MLAVKLVSTITCPVCGHQRTESMPTDACQYFYECHNCKTAGETKSRRLLRVLFFWGLAVSPNSRSAGERRANVLLLLELS